MTANEYRNFVLKRVLIFLGGILVFLTCSTFYELCVILRTNCADLDSSINLLLLPFVCTRLENASCTYDLFSLAEAARDFIQG